MGLDELLIPSAMGQHVSVEERDNPGIRLIKIFASVILVLIVIILVRLICPHDSSYDKKRAQQIIISAVNELNYGQIQVIDIDYISRKQLPEEENWDDDAYRVVTILKGTDIKFVNTVDCNIVHNPYAKKSLNTSQYADQLKVASHPLTDREITLLKEYSKVSKHPIEDFGYTGSLYKTGVGEWVVSSDSGQGYYFLYKKNSFHYLRKDNG